jgi:3',5'-cyclic AMP phosphodiesterase CpdA
MRRIVQLSDLHFGRIVEGTCASLERALARLQPDLVIVSGDLTQRARPVQFRHARQFLARLPQPVLCVPGNHDVPLYDVFTRLLNPMARYRRWISQEVDVFYEDDTISVAALNTAHGWTGMDGRLTAAQCDAVRRHFDRSPGRLRMVVTHHPLDLPPTDAHPVPVRAHTHLPHWIDELGVDLFLAGHLHRSRALLGPVRVRARRRAVFTQAGTSTSDRHSGYGNAFNFLSVQPDAVDLEHWHADAPGDDFSVRESARFRRCEQGWQVA